ncbi:MAG: protease HtpX [Methylococcaceae bacterium]|nr:protease HtpX [Methylococcaceae bacterium]
MRILLFLMTNLAILVVVSLLFRLLGINGILDQQGVNLDLNSLLMMSALIGMTGSVISLMMSKFMAKRAMGVQIIGKPSNASEQWIVQTVQRQARDAGIGMPEIGIFDSPDSNAFATGMNKNAALVAVSTGLLRNMDSDEVEAVIGHEITHVANGDMVTLALIQGVVNTFVYFFASVIGFVVDRVILRNERGVGLGYHITQIVAQICLSFLATAIVMWFSRQREFRADAGGAALAGRQKMISALRTLQRAHEPQALPGEFAAFGINSGVAEGLRKIFMSHPPLEERIAALQQSV